MNGFRGTKVIPPRRREPVKPRVRRKPPKLNREVEHRTLGTGTLLWVRQLSDGSDVAVVRFSDEAERTIRLDPAYWVTAISEIMQLAPRLSPPPAPEPVEPVEASTVEEEEDADEEPELGEEVTEAEEDEHGDEAEPCAAA